MRQGSMSVTMGKNIAGMPLSAATLVGALLTAGLLTGCGSESTGDATGVDVAQATSDASTDTTGADDSAAWCARNKNAGEDVLEVSFGDIQTASDEWARSLGRETRHYVPVTLRNITDKDCSYNIKVGLEVDGELLDTKESFSRLLPAGETAIVQLFDLDELVEVGANGEVTSTVTPEIASISTVELLPEYYDMTYVVGERQGEDSNTLIPVSASLTKVNEGMPERLFTAHTDVVFLQGLDAQGRVIVQTGNQVDEPTFPVVDEEVWFALGGGDSSGYDRQLYSLDTVADVAQWRLFRQPYYTELAKGQ